MTEKSDPVDWKTQQFRDHAAATRDPAGDLKHALRHAIEIIERFVPVDALGIETDKVDGSASWPLRDEYLHNFRSALAAAEAAGMVMVPKVPTEAMISAGARVWANHPGYRIGYKHPITGDFSAALGGPKPSEFYAAMIEAASLAQQETP